jgi:hypothetical protein
MLMADIQFLGLREETQEELIQILLVLIEGERQIVISADQCHEDLTKLKWDLHYFIQEGLIADIQPPTIETRAAYLMKSAEMENIVLPHDMIYFLATMVEFPEHSILRYRSFLKWLNASAAYKSSRLTPDSVKEILRGTMGERHEGTSQEKRVQLVDATRYIIKLLRQDYSNVYQLDPETFEILICNRLSKSGLTVERVGTTYVRDGGVDLIAWPSKHTGIPYLLAGQIKHHKLAGKKTDIRAVRDFQGVIASLPFHMGLIVTNTTFTSDAKWFAENMSHILRLRDIEDLKRWIWDNFTDPAEWREMPSSIELAPGLTVPIPIFQGLPWEFIQAQGIVQSELGKSQNR